MIKCAPVKMTLGWNALQGVENVHTLCAGKPEPDDRVTTDRRCFHEVTVVKKNCIHFALRFSSLPSLRENKDDICKVLTSRHNR